MKKERRFRRLLQGVFHISAGKKLRPSYSQRGFTVSHLESHQATHPGLKAEASEYVHRHEKAIYARKKRAPPRKRGMSPQMPSGTAMHRRHLTATMRKEGNYFIVGNLTSVSWGDNHVFSKKKKSGRFPGRKHRNRKRAEGRKKIECAGGWRRGWERTPHHRGGETVGANGGKRLRAGYGGIHGAPVASGKENVFSIVRTMDSGEKSAVPAFTQPLDENEILCKGPPVLEEEADALDWGRGPTGEI